ncbi:unnamed protein product [Fusarium graminearum]|uniref:Chromosome 1, complete genome n=1 Tax=Gibberella zeae (strain ATCC MYA-4620 / CBS 123657 / FGSC 9075 / NRRL 31084 / PH-1) TaxID=229533 RepID=A0A098DBX3_GIBZE|nr:unnamed protein product [Fusarium graminearum]
MATGWESWTGSATGLFSGGAAGVVTGAGVAVEANRERHELMIWRGDQNRGSGLPRTAQCTASHSRHCTTGRNSNR